MVRDLVILGIGFYGGGMLIALAMAVKLCRIAVRAGWCSWHSALLQVAWDVIWWPLTILPRIWNASEVEAD